MILASTKHLYQAITVSQKKTRLSQNIPHPTVHDMKEKRKKKTCQKHYSDNPNEYLNFTEKDLTQQFLKLLKKLE